MKSVAPELELQVIKTLASTKSQKQVAALFSSIDDACFYTRAAKQCFARLKTLMRERGEMVTWSELQVDPVIDDTIREKLSRFKKKPIKFESIEKAINVLHKYRRARTYIEIGNLITQSFQGKSLDVDALGDQIAKKMVDATSRKGDMQKWFLHIGGKGDGDIEAVKKLMKQDDRRFIPTGFKAFDSINHGLPRGALFILAGNTGAGKSVLAGQLVRNMARRGARVCIVPLEMKNEEMLQRELSRTADVEMSRIISPKCLSQMEKDRILGRYKKLRTHIKKVGGLLSLFSPEEDMTAEEVLFALKPFSYDVIIFDYIGLLKGIDGDDQWRAMRNVTRFSKRYASINDIVVGFCAQLSDEGVIRYAKGMIEDASNAWFFTADARSRETGVVFIDQKKARNQAAFRFPLFMHYSRMLVRDLNDQELEQVNAAKEKAKNKGKEKPKFGKAKKSTKKEEEDEEDFFQADD